MSRFPLAVTRMMREAQQGVHTREWKGMRAWRISRIRVSAVLTALSVLSGSGQEVPNKSTPVTDYLQHSTTLILKRDLEGAMAELQTALRLNPEDADVQYL